MGAIFGAAADMGDAIHQNTNQTMDVMGSLKLQKTKLRDDMLTSELQRMIQNYYVRMDMMDRERQRRIRNALAYGSRGQ